jgi:putative membrane protein
MAGERTALAWLRTGLTVIAVGVGVGKIAPEFGETNATGYALLGVAYALLGVGVILYGVIHGRAVDAAVREDRMVPPAGAAMAAVGGVAVVLSLVTAALITAEV